MAFPPAKSEFRTTYDDFVPGDRIFRSISGDESPYIYREPLMYGGKRVVSCDEYHCKLPCYARIHHLIKVTSMKTGSVREFRPIDIDTSIELFSYRRTASHLSAGDLIWYLDPSDMEFDPKLLVVTNFNVSNEEEGTEQKSGSLYMRSFDPEGNIDIMFVSMLDGIIPMDPYGRQFLMADDFLYVTFADEIDKSLHRRFI